MIQLLWPAFSNVLNQPKKRLKLWLLWLLNLIAILKCISYLIKITKNLYIVLIDYMVVNKIFLYKGEICKMNRTLEPYLWVWH